MMIHRTHSEVVNRLKRADGHLRTIIEMIEKGRSCLQLAQQLQAVENAIDNAKKALIHDHISHCLDRSLKAPGAKAGRRCGSSRSSLSTCDSGEAGHYTFSACSGHCRLPFDLDCFPTHVATSDSDDARFGEMGGYVLIPRIRSARPIAKRADQIYRGNIPPRGAISAISAINFLMSKSPKELKSFATKTKAPGPPTT